MKKVILTQPNGEPVTLNLAENGAYITKKAGQFFSIGSEEVKVLTEEFNSKRGQDKKVLYKYKRPYWENNTDYIHLTAANDKKSQLKLAVHFHGVYGGNLDYFYNVTRLDVGGDKTYKVMQTEDEIREALETGVEDLHNSIGLPRLEEQKQERQADLLKKLYKTFGPGR